MLRSKTLTSSILLVTALSLNRDTMSTQAGGTGDWRRLFRLHCGVQHYAWGDTRFIPALLGIDNAEQKPYAELWLGAHPDLPAQIELDGAPVPLNDVLVRAAEVILGADVCAAWDGQLPYLMKVLSARFPLSIQVHPSKRRAREGFARENAAGIPISAPNRNYRDENHKPELLVALTDFYALRGFRPLAEIERVIAQVPELQRLASDFEATAGWLRAFYEKFMTLPQPQVDAILDPVVRRFAEQDRRRPLICSQPGYWLLRADRQYSQPGQRDRGLLSLLLLNLVHLEPGMAIYLSAGILHAYLQGSGVEIMANSNNVLRGGLTPKHVDVRELLANVEFEGKAVELLPATWMASAREWVYRPPVREFELRRIEITDGQPHTVATDYGARILIVLAADRETTLTACSGSQALDLSRGSVLLAPHGVCCTIRATGTATLYMATVPAG